MKPLVLIVKPSLRYASPGSAFSGQLRAPTGEGGLSASVLVKAFGAACQDWRDTHRPPPV